ncbi:MAG TPA: Fur family transcriptional regulator [Elusimicrobiales bacterium]|nr:Fur family transcriptional regulator [Elusimicrobiales bacterium]
MSISINNVDSKNVGDKKIDSIKCEMERKGYTLTKPRSEILEFILKQTGHLNAEKVYQQLKRKKLGRSTVFRAFNLFKEMGFLEQKPVVLAKNYELKEKPLHFHMLCSKCGSICEFTNSNIHKICQKKVSSEKFKMKELSLEIRGLCRKCATKKTGNMSEKTGNKK